MYREGDLDNWSSTSKSELPRNWEAGKHPQGHTYVRSSGNKYTKHGLGHEGGAKHAFRREAIEESSQLVRRKEGH